MKTTMPVIERAMLSCMSKGIEGLSALSGSHGFGPCNAARQSALTIVNPESSAQPSARDSWLPRSLLSTLDDCSVAACCTRSTALLPPCNRSSGKAGQRASRHVRCGNKLSLIRFLRVLQCHYNPVYSSCTQFPVAFSTTEQELTLPKQRASGLPTQNWDCRFANISFLGPASLVCGPSHHIEAEVFSSVGPYSQDGSDKHHSSHPGCPRRIRRARSKRVCLRRSVPSE